MKPCPGRRRSTRVDTATVNLVRRPEHPEHRRVARDLDPARTGIGRRPDEPAHGAGLRARAARATPESCSPPAIRGWGWGW